MSRIFFTALGLMAVGVGAVGVWVPGLPTTPFLIIALLCFTRGNPKLHAWLLRSKFFGKFVATAEEFLRTGRIGLKTKAVAIGCAWGSFAIVFLAEGARMNMLVGWVLAAAVAGTIVILQTKSH